MPAPVPPGHLTPRQLADRWGCAVRTVYDAARRGEVRAKVRRGHERGMVFALEDVKQAEKEVWR